MLRNITELNLLSLFILCSVLVLDSLGVYIIYPVLIGLILDPSTTVLDANSNNFTLVYSTLLATYWVFAFFGYIIIGHSSDKFGRKCVLLVCMLGSCLGFVLCSFCEVIGQVWILYIGRMLCGFFSGANPVAVAGILDLASNNNKSNQEYIKKKSIYLSFVGISFSLGAIFGPFLLILSRSILGPISEGKFNYIDTYSVAIPSVVRSIKFQNILPFLFSAALCLFLFCLLFFLYENHNIKQNNKVNIKFNEKIIFSSLKSFYVLLDILKRDKRKVFFGLLVCISVQLGWGLYSQSLPLIFFNGFSYDSAGVAIVMMSLGLFGIIGAIIYPILLKLFSFRVSMIFWMLVSLIGYIYISFLNSQEYSVWVGIILITISVFSLFSLTASFLSGLVHRERYGWIMGVRESSAALCGFVSAFPIVWLQSFNLYIPVILATILCIIGMLLYIGFCSVYKVDGKE